jgi:hypothetical protein
MAENDQTHRGHRDGISLREEAVLVDALKNWPPKA